MGNPEEIQRRRKRLVKILWRPVFKSVNHAIVTGVTSIGWHGEMTLPLDLFVKERLDDVPVAMMQQILRTSLMPRCLIVTTRSK